MTIHEMTILMQDGLIGLVIILLGLVRIPRLDINFWGLIAKSVGNALNHDISIQVKEINTELQNHITTTEEYRIRRARQRILRFSDEVMIGQKHSLEHYNDILEDVDLYEDYCDAHPGYINNKAEVAIKIVRDTYEEHLKNNDFLTYVEK